MRVRAQRVLGAVLGLAAGVGSCRDVLQGPPAGDAHTLVLLVATPGGAASGYALDATQPAALPLLGDELRAADQYALLYTAELAALGWAEGRLALGVAAPGDTSRSRLPKPDRLYREPAHTLGWMPLAELPAALAALSLPVSGPPPQNLGCDSAPTYAEQLALAGDTFLFGFAESSTSAILGTRGGRYMRLLPDGSFGLIRASAPGGLAGLRDAAGMTWILGETDLWRGGFSGGFQRLAALPDAAGGKGWISAAPGATDEVFLVTEARRFLRYTSGSMSQLEKGMPGNPRDHDKPRPSVLAIGPGEAYATGFSLHTIEHARSGTVTSEPFGRQVDVVPEGVASSGLGTVVADDAGRLFTPGDFGWVSNTTVSFGQDIFRVVGFRDGIVVAGDQDQVGFYGPKLGLCDLHRLGVPGANVVDLVPVGNDLVVVVTDTSTVVFLQFEAQ
jgi:hypothetical protein